MLAPLPGCLVSECQRVGRPKCPPEPPLCWRPFRLQWCEQEITWLRLYVRCAQWLNFCHVFNLFQSLKYVTKCSKMPAEPNTVPVLHRVCNEFVPWFSVVTGHVFVLSRQRRWLSSFHIVHELNLCADAHFCYFNFMLSLPQALKKDLSGNRALTRFKAVVTC